MDPWDEGLAVRDAAPVGSLRKQEYWNWDDAQLGV